MRSLLGLMIALQISPNPAWIPAWSGREPIRYAIAPSARHLRPQVERAFRTWASVTGLPYWEETNEFAFRTITYRVEDSSVLAHAMYPPPLFSEPWAGDVFLTSRVQWAGFPDWALAYLLHETGHAFGLGESSDPADLTCPSWILPWKLQPSAGEVRRIRCLYQGICN